MTSIEKLTEIFSKFPGIGPRQAQRFVYFLLSKDEVFLKNFSQNILDIKKEVKTCKSCFKFFPMQKNPSVQECDICSDQNRDKETLMLVCRDVDLENIEKSKFFSGRYFLLGGTVPVLEKEPEKRIRAKELLKRVEKDAQNNLKEIILAFNPNPEGENTADFVKKILEPLAEAHSIKISTLGKGLSTGVELEYSDSETIKHALQNKR